MVSSLFAMLVSGLVLLSVGMVLLLRRMKVAGLTVSVLGLTLLFGIIVIYVWVATAIG